MSPLYRSCRVKTIICATSIHSPKLLWSIDHQLPLACRFWLAVQELKKRPIREVPTRVQEIWQEFLAPGAPSAINVDSKSYDKTTQNVKDPGRYAFEDAQVHMIQIQQMYLYRVINTRAALLFSESPLVVWFYLPIIMFLNDEFFQQEHIYKLMKSDSYSRFIRSSAYQELLQAKKKVKKQLDAQYCRNCWKHPHLLF